MTKTYSFYSIHEENTSKSSLHSNLIIFTDFHSFTVNEEKLRNESIFKIAAKVLVCDLGQNLIMTKTFNSFPFIKKTHFLIVFTFRFDHFDWFSQLYSKWRQTSKLVNLKISAKVLVCDFGQNLKMTKTYSFYSIHEENTCKSSLHLNLIILTNFHNFTVNEEKLQN